MITRDTIAAIATASGRAGIGVVRVSGPDLEPLIQGLVPSVLTPRRATLTAFRDASGVSIDEGIALYFPAPHSYTGEDVLELQGHGGPIVLRMLLQRCVDLGARIAFPGEFTQRAFLNGKLDLAQAESVADLIDATTTQAARCAIRSLSGEFSNKIQSLSSMIIDLRARVEAALDFPEEDLDALECDIVQPRLAQLQQALGEVVEAARQGNLLREGLHIVFAGRPNVGKSSLLNRLAGEDLAIVTEIPGTTRDPIQQILDIGGIPVRVVDTAGLRKPTDPVEEIGVERAWNAIGRADVVMPVVDAVAGVTREDEAILARLPRDIPRLRVMNKIDLLGQAPRLEEGEGESVIWLSAKTGAGIDLLRASLLQLAGWHGQGESVFLARARHLSALKSAANHLSAAVNQGRHLEIVAEELRLAHNQLTSITGEFTPDDLLGEIFSRFCIGK